MIILDTNVISEWVKPQPDARVLDWAASFPDEPLCITAVTLGELRFGVARLPVGHRRDRLAMDIDAALETLVEQTVLPFDRDAAEVLGDVLVTRQHMGRPIELADAQIAAICRSTGATLATRNTADFEGLGLTLINPWEWTAA